MPDKLKQLIEKREALAARIRLEQNKLKSVERRSDTRRKILAGAMVMEWAQRDSEFSAKLMKELDRFLVRDIDRELFRLPPTRATDQVPPSKPVQGIREARDLSSSVPERESA